MTFTIDIADRFARLALSHVGHEYPNKLDHVITGEADIRGPRALHPIFFGSFDWHSCVHGYWLLARALRRHPMLTAAAAIGELFDTRIDSANVRAECAYIERPSARGFERPYGWAWLLALQAELDLHPGGAGGRAAARLRPLAELIAQRFVHFLPLMDYPVRTGVHSSSAFALRLAADFAECNDRVLFELMCEKARSWYGADRDAQAWEPSQDDFLSPVLMEAECMRRFLAPDAFGKWLADFLPRAGAGTPAALFVPVRVSDRTDGKIAHLDGLNLSRAWCWRAIAQNLPEGHPLLVRANATARTHLDASLASVAGDYMREHWLATFATLALDLL
ncbi:MAG: DUF2891 domain-containing protein [Burkholderiales bacterium]|nr:DUF2891 domain-containing protein [Burkholderiales bacterium]